MSEDILKKKIKEKKIAGVYVFYGDEEYMKDYYLDSMRKIIAENPMPEFNRVIFDGDDLNISEIADALETFPSGSDIKMIEIRSPQFDKMTESESEEYISLLDDFPPYAALVFILRAGEVDKSVFAPRSKSYAGELVKEIVESKQGCVVNFEREPDYKLVSWIKRHFAKSKVIVLPDVPEQMISMCGNDMCVLAGETEKLINYYSGNPLTVDDVKKVCSSAESYRVFDMSSAAAAGNYKRAFNILANLKFNKTPPELITATLGKTFSEMLCLKDAQIAGKSQQQVASALKIPDWQIKKINRVNSDANIEFLRYAVEECGKLDLKIKTMSKNPYFAVKEMLIALCAFNALQKESAK